MRTVRIHALDSEGRGIARDQGKTVFVSNALPAETVRCRTVRRHSRFDEAESVEILSPSPHRVAPACPHYGECGGCAMQHIEFTAQTAFKQRIFEEQLARIGKIAPEQLLPPVYGSPWHYRSRTRLNAGAHGELGYQSRRSHRIVEVESCAVLPESVSRRLPALRAALRGADGLQAVEIFHGNRAAVNLISRRPLPQKVWHALAAVCPDWQLWRQHGHHAAEPLAENAPLFYRLPEFDLTMPFRMGDFTQINLPLNELMVARAVRLLDPQAHETVADLFCGLGNFSLPLARSGARVYGWEGADGLTRRARANARANGLKNAEFATADLFGNLDALQKHRFDKVLLDPPRAGAYAWVRSLRRLPARIVYVSCNPATLARDAAVLADKGYRLHSAGIINMFPQTAHVEAVARFDLK